MLTRFDQREILTSLHAGMLEMPLWSTFLERLTRRLGAAGSALRMIGPRSPDGVADLFSFTLSGDESPDGKAQAEDRLPYSDLRPGRVYSLDELFLPDGNGFAEEAKRHMRIMRVAPQSGYEAWLSIWRGVTRFSAADTSFIADLAPHLETAIRVFGALERERSRERRPQELRSQLLFGRIALDGLGQVIEVDDAAREFLRRTGLLRIRARGRLVPASAEADRDLTHALRDFASDPQARGRSVRLSDDPWVELLLVPGGSAGTKAGSKVAAQAYINGDTAPDRERIIRFREQFNLTQSEAQLALCLTHGLNLTEAATRMKITELTARGYSKALFGKTGTRGQADLVRVLMASLAAAG